MGTYAHDGERLRSMAVTLRSLKDGFGAIAADVDETRGVFGSGEVADAFEGFATNWSDARDELNGQIDGAVETLDSAAAVYDDLERQIVETAQGGGG